MATAGSGPHWNSPPRYDHEGARGLPNNTWSKMSFNGHGASSSMRRAPSRHNPASAMLDLVSSRCPMISCRSRVRLILSMLIRTAAPDSGADGAVLYGGEKETSRVPRRNCQRPRPRPRRGTQPAAAAERSEDWPHCRTWSRPYGGPLRPDDCTMPGRPTDRKSTRLNSSHVAHSYAVF